MVPTDEQDVVAVVDFARENGMQVAPQLTGHNAAPLGAMENVIAAAGPGSGSQLSSVELRHLGGTLARSAAHHGALANLDGSYLVFGGGLAADDASRRAVHAQVERLRQALAPYDTGRRYLNFAERRTDPAHFYAPDAYLRLRVVKAATDPQNVFRANHPIPGLTADEYTAAA